MQRRQSNSRSFDHKSNVLTTTPPSHTGIRAGAVHVKAVPLGSDLAAGYPVCGADITMVMRMRIFCERTHACELISCQWLFIVTVTSLTSTRRWTVRSVVKMALRRCWLLLINPAYHIVKLTLNNNKPRQQQSVIWIYYHHQSRMFSRCPFSRFLSLTQVSFIFYFLLLLVLNRGLLVLKIIFLQSTCIDFHR